MGIVTRRIESGLYVIEDIINVFLYAGIGFISHFFKVFVEVKVIHGG
jgi:hypothetical protein